MSNACRQILRVGNYFHVARCADFGINLYRKFKLTDVFYTFFKHDLLFVYRVARFDKSFRNFFRRYASENFSVFAGFYLNGYRFSVKFFRKFLRRLLLRGVDRFSAAGSPGATGA